jgi:CHAD domain-containing protein
MQKKAHIEWDERAGPISNARRELPALAADYFAYVREVLAHRTPPAELHRVRLATKRLRYTLELFRDCYGPGLEARLEALRKVQQALGDLNDSVASRELLKKAMGSPAQSARVDKFLEQRAREQARQFRQHWAEVFDAEGREQWFAGYLSRNARTPRG